MTPGHAYFAPGLFAALRLLWPAIAMVFASGARESRSPEQAPANQS